ncbi:MAG TPA: hypothetical protein VKC61_19205 [Pyrinomonadaceae bacterium]|nr:hypothetical protein [Pyrinomonadaceae bacterium]
MLISSLPSRTDSKSNRADVLKQIRTDFKQLQELNNAKTDSVKNISNSNEYRAALLVLDSTIMRFVNNPIFRTPNTLEIDLAVNARQDLESIIVMTLI